MNILKNKKFLSSYNFNSHITPSQLILRNFQTKNFSESQKSIRNFPKQLEDKMDLNLYQKKNHPLNIIRNKIINFFEDEKFKSQRTLIPTNNPIKINENLPKIVSLKDNFYDLLVEQNHESVSPKNTYYYDNDNVLRTHMTSHDVKLLKEGHEYFISIGDVYRRDEIDATHYPIFHQVDSVRVFNRKDLLNMDNPYKNKNDENKNSDVDKDTQHCLDIVSGDLKYTLENLNK